MQGDSFATEINAQCVKCGKYVQHQQRDIDSVVCDTTKSIADIDTEIFFASTS